MSSSEHPPAAPTALLTTPFGATSTAAEVVEGLDLRGRTALVTGAASGIGVEIARALAATGMAVTLAVRDTAAGQRVAADITATTGNTRVDVVALDLADVASVDALTAAWRGPLHVLVNNAGVMMTPQARTAQGWELQLATNHLGHLALATGLHSALTAAGDARIVSVSSSGHGSSDVVLDDLMFERRPYDPGLAYGQSKTANVLLAVEATRRWAVDGITANALMPGGIFTNLQRHWDPAVLARTKGRSRHGRQNRRAGRRHLGPARHLARARRCRRTLLRGLPAGRGRAGDRRRSARRPQLRPRPGLRRAALGNLRNATRRGTLVLTTKMLATAGDVELLQG